MKLTLWGRRAQEFNIDNVYNASDAKPIVTLFVGCLMRSFYNNANSACKIHIELIHFLSLIIIVFFLKYIYKSCIFYSAEQYLSGSSACKWYFNPEIPEAQAFHTR